MQRFGSPFCRFKLLFSVIVPIVFLSACDDNAIVGGPFSPDELRINADSIQVSDVSYLSTPSFSGNLSHVTAGSVQDPLFGEIKALALMRPSRVLSAGTDTIIPYPEAHLSLVVQDLYGPASNSAKFEIVTIDRRWRTVSWRYDSIPDLSNNVIGRFTVTEADSIPIKIELDRNWANEYREFVYMDDANADSLYRNTMPGFAIVPADDYGKLFSVQFDNMFVVFPMPEDIREEKKEEIRLQMEAESDNGTGEEGEESEEIVVPDPRIEFPAYATSILSDLPDPAQYSGAYPVWNTQKGILELDFSLSEEFVGTNSFSRLELVIYEDNETMDSYYPPGFDRPKPQTIRLFLKDRKDFDYAISSGDDPRFQANRRDDGSYRVNMTSFAYDQMDHRTDPEKRKFYLVSGFNDGRIMPLLLGNPQHPGKKPVILVTEVTKD